MAYQYWKFRRQVKKSSEGVTTNAKKRVITSLFAYRFVFTGNRRNDPEPKMHFNVPLSSIPVHFSHTKECIDHCRSIGNDFNAEKFYNIIIMLMKNVTLSTDAIDKHLLENVPKITPKTH